MPEKSDASPGVNAAVKVSAAGDGKVAPRGYHDEFVLHVQAGATMLVTSTRESQAIIIANEVCAETLKMRHITWDRLAGFGLLPPPPSDDGDSPARSSALAKLWADYREQLKQLHAACKVAAPTEFNMMPPEPDKQSPSLKNFSVAFRTVLALENWNDTLFSFCEPHFEINHAGDPTGRALIQQAFRGNLFHKVRHAIHLLLPGGVDIHPEVAGCFVPVDFMLPTLDELRARTVPLAALPFSLAYPEWAQPDADLTDAMARACLGLDRRSAEHGVSLAVRSCSGFNEAALAAIQRHKCKQIRTNGILTFLEPDKSLYSDLAGLDRLFADLRRMAHGYTVTAERHNLDVPSGVALTGVSGGGKTAAAKAAGGIFQEATGQGWPVVLIDLGAVMAGTVGKSEENLRNVFAVLRTLNGCVAIFDEWEKISAGSAAGTVGGDGGLTRRLFGSILTWLEEKGKTGERTFVVATMNDTQGIPPEFFARFVGRYFFDLPTAEAVAQIIQIHFNKRLLRLGKSFDDLSWSADDLKEATAACSQFSGREIEQVVVASRNRAQEAGREWALPLLKDFIDEAVEARPTSLHIASANDLESMRARLKPNSRPVYALPPKAVTMAKVPATAKVTNRIRKD